MTMCDTEFEKAEREAATRPAITSAQRRALMQAALRERGNVCPIKGCWAAAETALLDALRQKGYIDDSIAPRITNAGRLAIAGYGAATASKASSRKAVLQDEANDRPTYNPQARIDAMTRDEMRVPRFLWELLA